MNPIEVDQWSRRCRWFLLGGLLVFGLGLRFESPMIISGFMAIWLGAAGMLAGLWHNGLALWMLFAILTVMAAATYAIMLYGTLQDELRSSTAGFWLWLDATVGLAILWKQVRLMASATYLNWQVDHQFRIW